MLAGVGAGVGGETANITQLVGVAVALDAFAVLARLEAALPERRRLIAAAFLEAIAIAQRIENG